MVEKFSEYESKQYLGEEGEFLFTVKNAEIKQSSKGNDMVVFEVEAYEGTSTLYMPLVPNARWKYNNFIKACMKLDTKEKIDAFECDYFEIHNKLIGKTFRGVVKRDTYERVVKMMDPETGLCTDVPEERVSYKIEDFKIA